MVGAMTAVIGTIDATALNVITDNLTRLTVASGAANTTVVDAPGTLSIGASTATFITIGRSTVPLSVPGGLHVSAGFADAVDTSAAGELTFGTVHATSIVMGQSSVPVTLPGGVRVGPNLADSIDTSAAGSLTIGGTNASAITIGQSAAPVSVPGGVLVAPNLANSIDANAAGSLTIGGVNASAITIGQTMAPVVVPGGLVAQNLDVPTAGGGLFLGGVNAESLLFGNNATTAYNFTLTAAREMQLSSRGYVMTLSNAANAPNSHALLILAGESAGGTTSNFAAFISPSSTLCGAITQESTNTVAYGTSSDARLKENVKDSARGLSILRRLRVREYNFIGDTRAMQGFLAQEMVEIYPDAVHKGGEDPKVDPFSIDYGKLTPLLTRAIQELSDKCERLETQVAQLSSRVGRA